MLLWTFLYFALQAGGRAILARQNALLNSYLGEYRQVVGGAARLAVGPTAHECVEGTAIDAVQADHREP